MSLEVNVTKRFDGFTLHAAFTAGDTATALSSDARTLCHDGLNDLFCGLPCGIHKAASRAVTEIFCHVHFSFLAKNA